jgi:hypothetical protein
VAKFDEEEEETYEEDGVDVMGKVNYGTDGEVEMMKRVVRWEMKKRTTEDVEAHKYEETELAELMFEVNILAPQNCSKTANLGRVFQSTSVEFSGCRTMD